MWNIFKLGLCACFLCASLAITGCTSATAEIGATSNTSNCVETRTVGVPRGTALLVHGLNNKPTVMAELGAELSGIGFNTVQASLPWHGDNRAEPPTLDNLRSSVSRCAEKTLVDHPSGIHLAIGFSLGGALIAEFIQNNQDEAFDEVILFAPAIALTSTASIGSALTFLRHLNINIPTLANKEIRNNRWVPAELYNSLYRLSDHLDSIPTHSALHLKSVTIFLSISDTLVAPRGTQEWLERNKLSSWNIVELSPEPTISNTFNHLVITRSGLGENEWNRMMEKLKQIALNQRPS